MRKLVILLLTLFLLLIPIGLGNAQTYSFSLDREIVHVYWNGDGTATIEYTFVFRNDTGVSPIDFVDVGIPNSNYDLSTITAEINGQPITNIEPSPYVSPGVAIGLGNRSIPPGQTGTVLVRIQTVRDVYNADTSGDNYASAVFSPTWFDKEFVHGNTDLTVVFHLPAEVQPDEPRWHESPPGWMAQPITGIDEEGRITYTWQNPNANGYAQYTFGASFPLSYLPEGTVTTPGFGATLGVIISNLIPCACVCGVFALVIAIFAAGIRSSQRRKMRYLPPKVAIEGHGIKRGLTAVEAAILMEQPMDKILTMTLFAVVKKGAASVKSREPLEIEVVQPISESSHQYEQQFLEAFLETGKRERQRALQEMMVSLIKSVGKKMKGFSHKETLAYYKNIIEKAWKQVEAADTPEVKSQKYDEVMEWTMLDREYEDRTRQVFHTGPVFIPIWWPRYDPGYSGPSVSSRTIPSPAQRGSTPSMPTLPGSAFAASVVTGVQNMSSSVVGNLTSFTSRITDQTNPVPKSSGGSFSGGGCACACACAGCACACAGGGR